MSKGTKKLSMDIFYMLIGAYIAAMFLEYLKPGLISNYVDLNKAIYVLVPVALICVFVGISSPKKHKEENYD